MPQSNPSPPPFRSTDSAPPPSGGPFRPYSVGHPASGRGLWLSPGGQQPLLWHAALPQQGPGALLVR